MSTVQRQQVDRVLKRIGGNKSEAARVLGISRRSLYRWIERLERCRERGAGEHGSPTSDL